MPAAPKSCPTCGKPNCGNWAACERRKKAELENERRKKETEQAHNRLTAMMMMGHMLQQDLDSKLAEMVKKGIITQADVNSFTDRDRHLLTMAMLGVRIPELEKGNAEGVSQDRDQRRGVQEGDGDGNPRGDRG